MKYTIYHTTQIGFITVNANYLRDDALVEFAQNPANYELAGTIEADSLDEAYRLTQNDFGTYPNGWHPDGKRSTSVGDLIVDEADGAAITHVVDHFGFIVTGMKVTA